MPTPNTADAMKRYKAGKAGFTDKAHLKAKGLIPRADGTKRKSPKYEDLDKGDVKTIKPIIKQLKKSVKTHATQAKQLTKDISDNFEEDMDAQPQDKDVKKVKGTQPKKYYKTLDKKTKKKRADFFKTRKPYRKSDDDDDYKAAPGDAKAKTKPSGFTKKFKKMYGEDAPANATGTAVAGTGDDSSTVVVKKKKKMQDKLMKRLGIQETLDRLVPDLEYTEDEITARKNKLKEMAVNAGKKLAQDPDVRKVKGTQPKKYYKTLSKADKDKRAAHFSKQDYKKSDGNKDYKPAPGDKDAKTKTSKYTKKFRQMYGEEILDEKIKGLENKAKKSGMPYGILKKVYDRGMAAWKGGHRPGTTQQQWAFARVNSFVTKSPGTWGKADSDLAKQVRGK